MKPTTHIVGGSNLDTQTVRQLQKADWGQIGKRLLAYAIKRARRYPSWFDNDGQLLAQGYSAKDIVQSVIEKTLTGQRKWDPNRGALEPWLMAQVNSEIDNLINSASHRHEKFLDEDTDGKLDKIEYSVVKGDIFGRVDPQNPETVILEREKNEYVRQQVDALFQAADSQPELEEVLEAIIDGCEPKPRFLAEELGISIKDVNNRLKRLRRRAGAVRISNE